MNVSFIGMSEVIATLGFIFSGDILIDRFRPHRCSSMGPLILCCGTMCLNEEVRRLTRKNEDFVMQEMKHPFCHYYAGLIGSHTHPPHEKIAHRIDRAMMRLHYLYDSDSD